jgi:steroid delta-isomerase-like uncharacterized protein
MIHVTIHHWIANVAGPSFLAVMPIKPMRTTMNLLALAALAAGACARTPNRSTAMPDPTTEENRRNVDQLFNTCFNDGDLGIIDGLFSPDYVGPLGDRGPDGFKKVVVGLRTAFPDIHYTVDDVVAEEDKVAVRWRWAGTHEAAFRTFPATHKRFSNTGTGIFRFRDSKIVAATLETDRLGFLQQMGAVPPDVVPNVRPSPSPAR